MWQVGLAVFAQVGAIGIDHGRRIVVNTSHLFFIDRYNDDHVVFIGILLHQPGGMPIRDRFSCPIPAVVLAGTEVRLRKNLLETQNLHARRPRLVD